MAFMMFYLDAFAETQSIAVDKPIRERHIWTLGYQARSTDQPLVYNCRNIYFGLNRDPRSPTNINVMGATLKAQTVMALKMNSAWSAY